MPFATPSKKATYIDPTVSIENGNTVVIGFQNFIGPYVNLNGGGGAIKIGNTSSVLDNATIVANPGLRHQKPAGLDRRPGRDRLRCSGAGAERDR